MGARTNERSEERAGGRTVERTKELMHTRTEMRSIQLIGGREDVKRAHERTVVSTDGGTAIGANDRSKRTRGQTDLHTSE